MDPILNSTPENFLENETNFRKILEDHVNWKQVPIINHICLDNLKDTSIVRFRGMIQDMLDPEIYLEKYEVNSRDSGDKIRIQQGKYRDCLVISPEECVNHDSADNAHGERRTLFVVSIPGFNNWALDIEKKHLCPSIENQKDILNKIDYPQSVKRPCSDEQSMDLDTVITETTSTTHKRIKSDNEATSTTSSSLSFQYLLNSPISERPGKACMVKIYSEFEKYTLNTVVDVIGFLSVDPALDGTTMECDENDFEDINEIQASNPPPSLIPRIHAIAIRKLEHSNPLLDLSIISTTDDESCSMGSLYKDLKLVLTQCLFGDVLSAEYLICHLISTVYVRTDFETLGQFSLNICNIPGGVYKKYTEELYEIIESILPTSHYLPMTLDNLNTKQFIPTKDYTTNKLTSGLLQLAPHTHLVLDETQLQPGKLESSGISAVQSLASLIKNQQIKYDFKFYELNFNTDIPVIILSEGRSMLPSNFQVPLSPDSETVSLIEETLKAAKHYLQPKLNNIRMYLTRAKLFKFNLNPDDSQLIENDFVEMRKSNPKTDAEVLHKHLVLSRLLGIAGGNEFFNKDCWQKAKEMEKERVDRINKLPKSRSSLN